jgi:hypothetical protein
MCIKRPRDDDSQSSLSWITNSSGRVVIDPSLVPVYFFILKVFLKKFKFFYFFLFQINILVVFLDYFDIKINYKKIKKYYFNTFLNKKYF